MGEGEAEWERKGGGRGWSVQHADHTSPRAWAAADRAGGFRGGYDLAEMRCGAGSQRCKPRLVRGRPSDRRPPPVLLHAPLPAPAL